MKIAVKKDNLLFPELSYEIVGAAYEVFNGIGYGHQEKFYQRALAKVFAEKKIPYKEQVYTPLKFKDEVIGRQYLDFLVDGKVIVELKKDARFSKAHIDQVISYLRTSDIQLAILINFAESGVVFKRIVNLPNYHKQQEMNS